MRSMTTSTSRSIDGAVNGSAAVAGLTRPGPEPISRRGFIKDYALVFFLGVVIFIGCLLF